MVEGGKALWNGDSFGEARCGTCIAFSFDCVCGGYCDAFGEFKVVAETDSPCEKYNAKGGENAAQIREGHQVVDVWDFADEMYNKRASLCRGCVHSGDHGGASCLHLWNMEEGVDGMECSYFETYTGVNIAPKPERTTVKHTTMEEDNKETVETNYMYALPPCLLRARDENSTVILEEWNDATPQEPETHFCKIASITRECKTLKLEDLVVGILLDGDDGSQRFFEFHPGNPNLSQVQHDGRVFRTASADKVSRLTVLLSEN